MEGKRRRGEDETSGGASKRQRPLAGEAPPKTRKTGKKKKRNRAFDWSKFSTRHIALRFCYIGWDYRGLAVQSETTETIEHHLFRALEKTKLVRSIGEAQYARAGRTDKGVSAFCQVVSLHVRSQLADAPGLVSVPKDKSRLKDVELDYVKMLNGTLPNDICVIAWAPVAVSFNARFWAMSRTYRYFFTLESPEHGPLDLERMREAGKRLLGMHDFRNFCRMDVMAVKNFVRGVLHFDIIPVDELGASTNSRRRLYAFVFRGHAFLWHQVRCMVAVLFLIGAGQEEPDLVSRLLDVERYPGKPSYAMASERPLVLWDVMYEDLQWVQTYPAMRAFATIFHAKLHDALISLAVVNCMHTGLFLDASYGADHVSWRTWEADEKLAEQAAMGGSRHGRRRLRAQKRGYIPLLERRCGETYEERVAAARNAGRVPAEDKHPHPTASTTTTTTQATTTTTQATTTATQATGAGAGVETETGVGGNQD